MIEIITGLYEESSSKRKPIYTTELKSKSFGGRHYTLEDLIKLKLNLPKVPTSYSGLKREQREQMSKRYKITIEEI
jgi:hypothetical protein